jgi:NADPH:quinone reductase-like Zn-dependent oxidoreductase
MKAVILTQHNHVNNGHTNGKQNVKVEELPIPAGHPIEEAHHPILVKLHCGALNHLDLFVQQGWPGLNLKFPHILGSDGAGRIAHLPKRLPQKLKRQFKMDQPVIINPAVYCGNCEFCKKSNPALCVDLKLFGEHMNGTYAEYLSVPASNLAPLPKHLSMQEGAALPLTFVTAWRMLMTQAKIKRHETVLIHGIGGGVALAALQLAKKFGCRVWVSSRSQEKLDRALKLGADKGFIFPDDNFSKTIRQLTDKRGVDVVIDSVGKATWPTSLICLRRGGRLVTCGATTGPIASTDINRVFWNQLTIYGSTMGSAAEFSAMLKFVNQHKIKPLIDKIFPLDQAQKAFERLAAGKQMGKIVLQIV